MDFLYFYLKCGIGFSIIMIFLSLWTGNPLSKLFTSKTLNWIEKIIVMLITFAILITTWPIGLYYFIADVIKRTESKNEREIQKDGPA